MGKTAKYICNWTVKHGGKFHDLGAPLELTESEAAPLLEAGAVTAVPAPAPAPAPTRGAKVAAVEEKVAEIVEGADQAPKTDPDPAPAAEKGKAGKAAK